MRPIIEDWFIGQGDYIVGHIYGHPDYTDGQIIITSRIAKLDEQTGEAYTQNTHYKLGKRFEE